MTVNLLEWWHLIAGVLGSIGVAIWWASSVHTKTGILGKSIGSIEEKLSLIEAAVNRILGKLNMPSVSESKSPSRLNDYGKDLSAKIDGSEMVKQFVGLIDVSENTREYAIQQKCFDFAAIEMKDRFSDEECEKLEKEAFSSGVAVDLLHTVLGYELRDAVFEKHGIDLDNIE